MKIGLIGYGYWGGGYVARNIARVAELAVIVDPDPSRMVSASEAWAPWGVRVASEPEVAFDACDAVWIATPVDTHAGLVGRALEAGCHVMCEKPFTLSLDEAEALADTAERKVLALMVGHLSLYTGAHQAARYACADEEQHAVEILRQTDRASISDKSVVWGLGPHDIAALLDIFGEPEEVEWSGSNHRSACNLKFGRAAALVQLDWLGSERKRRYIVDGQDYADYPDLAEPLLVEAQSFVDLCADDPEMLPWRYRQRWLACKTAAVLERAEDRAWL